MDETNAAARQSTVLPFQTIDYSSALSLSETRSITDDIYLDLCGIIRIKKNNGEYEYKRLSKPIITYDFANKIMTGVYSIANRITARTDFNEKEIKRYCYTNGKALMMDMAIDGMQHLISNEAWEYALKLTEKIILKDENGENILQENGENIVITGWEAIGLTWSYDMPFNIDHLNVIKERYSIDKESFGQDVIMNRVFWHIMTFIHGSLNRSKDALTLNHEKVIHKESIFQSESESKKNPENLIEKMKERINAITGGQKK